MGTLSWGSVRTSLPKTQLKVPKTHFSSDCFPVVYFCLTKAQEESTFQQAWWRISSHGTGSAFKKQGQGGTATNPKGLGRPESWAGLLETHTGFAPLLAQCNLRSLSRQRFTPREEGGCDTINSHLGPHRQAGKRAVQRAEPARDGLGRNVHIYTSLWEPGLCWVGYPGFFTFPSVQCEQHPRWDH